MKATHTLKFLALALLLAAIVFPGCKGDDCDPGEDCNTQEGELITKLSISLTNGLSGQLLGTFDFEDADGPGGNAPTADSIVLDSSTQYNGSIRVYATANGAQTDITPEILAEDHEHLFCFSSSGTGLSIAITDTDGTYAVGLQSIWAAMPGSSTGSVTVTLRHQPGVKDGTCAPGDTDVEAVFPLRIR